MMNNVRMAVNSVRELIAAAGGPCELNDTLGSYFWRLSEDLRMHLNVTAKPRLFEIAWREGSINIKLAQALFALGKIREQEDVDRKLRDLERHVSWIEESGTQLGNPVPGSIIREVRQGFAACRHAFELHRAVAVPVQRIQALQAAFIQDLIEADREYEARLRQHTRASAAAE